MLTGGFVETVFNESVTISTNSYFPKKKKISACLKCFFLSGCPNHMGPQSCADNVSQASFSAKAPCPPPHVHMCVVAVLAYLLSPLFPSFRLQLSPLTPFFCKGTCSSALPPTFPTPLPGHLSPKSLLCPHHFSCSGVS